ncbi:hypothetical protein [Priestia megaterium]|uniref:hypothetical protein n=1 Tax=Priestia megaterium TaxID=1404 RepID=UPI000BA5C5FE|nr:hypothetical protein [Priestia megaterium]PAK46836.1 hypothetical protein CHH47_22185 [Priestia megaterium]
MRAKHPLHYHFGEVTELFHYIYEVCETAGIYIDWSGTAQTVQLYRSKESFLSGERYIGAIQYEGSNQFQKRWPSTVSLRFRRANLSFILKYCLEQIEDYRKDTNKEPFINPNAESIAFKFTSLTDETKQVISKIKEVLCIANYV